ncbi:MAG: deoxyribonuclease V [Nitrospiria bacterium]
MDYQNLHPWSVSPVEAVQIQHRLRPKLILNRAPKKIKMIAGIDVSFQRGSNRLYAAIVVLGLDQDNSKQRSMKPSPFHVDEKVTASLEVDFPYIPGLLSFREIPVVLKAWEKLKTRPDCLICDGQGIAHPRRFGLAAHLGLIVDLPTIGCGKTRLVGLYREPGPVRGAYAPLVDRGETIGRVLRSRERVKPLFISPGHMMTQERAMEVILSCQRGYRLPEPTRLAHQFVNQGRKGQWY